MSPPTIVALNAKAADLIRRGHCQQATAVLQCAVRRLKHGMLTEDNPVPPQEKKDLWEEYKKTWTSKKQNTNTSANEARTKPKDQPTKRSTPKTTEKAHTVIKSRHSTTRDVHWASMAKSKQIPNTIHSELSQWLIDSGCSNHMTPYPEDLI